mgnify:FL=1
MAHFHLRSIIFIFLVRALSRTHLKNISSRVSGCFPDYARRRFSKVYFAYSEKAATQRIGKTDKTLGDRTPERDTSVTSELNVPRAHLRPCFAVSHSGVDIAAAIFLRWVLED